MWEFYHMPLSFPWDMVSKSTEHDTEDMQPDEKTLIVKTVTESIVYRNNSTHIFLKKLWFNASLLCIIPSWGSDWLSVIIGWCIGLLSCRRYSLIKSHGTVVFINGLVLYDDSENLSLCYQVKAGAWVINYFYIKHICNPCFFLRRT